MTGKPISKQDAIYTLAEAKEQMEKASTKAETIDVLQRAGDAVGYKPAFRALVVGVEPDKAVHWN